MNGTRNTSRAPVPAGHSASNRSAPRRSPSAYLWAGAAVAVALAVTAVVNTRRAKQAERDNPPRGKFVQVNGVRLHCLDRGEGEPLVLLHGNGSMIEDFESSGLIAEAAEKYRVIAFDRPGFGHSDRPRNVIWTPEAQAELIHLALRQIGVSRCVVLGHSWGASVAVALAQVHPELVASLVLASGYYFPTARADVIALSAPAIPLVGDILRYTLAPIISRLMWPMMLKKIFGPAAVPGKFAMFPKEMAFRPSQIRASAAESALMIPAAFASSQSYADLTMPVVIIAGDNDQLIDIDRQSARLHAEITQSTLHRVPGVGHMVHQSAPGRVMTAIDEAASAAHDYRLTWAAQQPSSVSKTPIAARNSRGSDRRHAKISA